jgi:radical SAM superfamily enzyme YgiQ (UPF0313 family)
MYKEEHKRFKPKPIAQIEEELASLSRAGYRVRRVFLADGDAMSLSVRRLKEILVLIQRYYPDVLRVSSYCLPRNLKNKSVEELSELRELGLKLMYVGCESGDDEVLRLVEKGETYQSSLSALKKIKQAGMKSSVMILNGMGGSHLSEQHALASAKLMNATQPEYLSTLVVNFPPGGEAVYAKNFAGRWKKLEQLELFREMEIMLEHLELEKTIFRSDHASNYLVLKGTLGKDKTALLDIVRAAIHRPGSIPLRAERQRGM